MQRRTASTALALALAALTTGAAAQEPWPSRPVTIVMPYAAGGPTDLVMRMLAQKMGDALGQPFLVVNAPGGSTMVGAERAARAAPDGYTLFIGSVTTFSNNPLMYRNIRYKVEDFAPVAMIARTPYTLTVAPNVPAKDFAEFIAYARQNQGKVFNATTGVGATNQLLGQMLNKEAGIRLVDVPYKGSGPALQDVMAGQVHLTFDGIKTSVPVHKAGKARVLAVTSEKRSAALPDVPTFAELGFPNLTAAFWFGMFAPAGTPPAVIDKLNTHLNAALASREIRARLTDDGLTIDGGTPQQLAATIVRDAQVWGPIIKALGIQLD